MLTKSIIFIIFSEYKYIRIFLFLHIGRNEGFVFGVFREGFTCIIIQDAKPSDSARFTKSKASAEFPESL